MENLSLAHLVPCCTLPLPLPRSRITGWHSMSTDIPMFNPSDKQRTRLAADADIEMHDDG